MLEAEARATAGAVQDAAGHMASWPPAAGQDANAADYFSSLTRSVESIFGLRSGSPRR